MADTDSDASYTDSDTSSDDEVTLSPVVRWYSKLYSRRVDIVGDYAGNELFLIEGDSLLLNCFSEKHLDFDPGFQLLHATYAVESFLHGLVARRCNFHIAFFDQHRELCVPQSASGATREKYLLARAAIIRHLRVHLKSTHPEIEVHVFPSVHSAAFAEYLQVTDLYFIMCHDGASTRLAFNRNKGPKDHAGLDAGLRTKTMFRFLIHWILNRGLNAALVNGLEWRDTKVITSVIESTRLTTGKPLSEEVISCFILHYLCDLVVVTPGQTIVIQCSIICPQS
jgi:hypothetical protein